MKKIIIAPDSFKGSCSSIEAARAIKEGVLLADDNAAAVTVPIADGGEGMIDAVTACTQASLHTLSVQNPLGEEILGKYARLANGGAVIEMAQASGLTLIPKERRNPLNTSTFGVGQMIRDAMDKGANSITIGLGGSATNDGGMGALAALGAVFLDAKGRVLRPCGESLEKVAQICLKDMDKRLARTQIVLACDVENPLTGPEGASFIYGPQKGADGPTVRRLDAGMARYAAVCAATLGRDVSQSAGAGAAGGLGFGLMAFCGAEFRSGIETILEISNFEGHLQGAHLVITGEGRIDGQSVYGKALWGIGQKAMAHGVPVAAIGGSLGQGWEGLLECGITAMFSMANGPLSLEEAMANTPALLRQSAQNIVRLFFHD